MRFLLVLAIVPAICSLIPASGQGLTVFVTGNGADDVGEIQLAINQVVAAGGGVVQLPVGQLDLLSSNTTAIGPALSVSNAANVAIVGAGIENTELVIHSAKAGAFRAISSTNITFSHFSVSYTDIARPFTQGTINWADPVNGVINVGVASGYPAIDSPDSRFGYTSQGYVHIYDPDTQLIRRGAPDATFFHNITQGAGGSWNINLVTPSDASYVNDNDRFVLPSVRWANAFMELACANNVYEHLRVHGSPSYGFGARISLGGPTFENITIIKKTDVPDGPLVSINADAFHITWSRTYGGQSPPTIKNCYISGMADDGININSHGMEIRAIDGSRTTIDLSNIVNVIQGDRLQIVRRIDSELIQTVTVAATPINQGGSAVSPVAITPPLHPSVFANPSGGGVDWYAYNEDSAGEGAVVMARL